VGVGANAFEKHRLCIHANTTIAKTGKKGKSKIAHISGFIEGRFPFQYCIVAFPYRRVVGQQVRAYRKEAGLSQEKLAEKASLSYKYLGEVERGCVNVSLDSLMRIAKALKVKVSDVMRDI
jgi:DNA-binding XRE family transcriptional regulator